MMEAGKSRVEIAALRHLQDTYALLKGSDDSEDPVTSPSSRQRRSGRSLSPQRASTTTLATIRSLQQQQQHSSLSKESIVTQWLRLEGLMHVLQADQALLEKEMTHCEAKTTEIQFLPVDLNHLTPKWLILSDVLGRETFEAYARDLHREVSEIRRRYTLYGVRMRRFQEHIRLHSIQDHQIRTLWSHDACRDALNRALEALDGEITAALLLSQYSLLVQHCAAPQKPDQLVLTEFLALITELTPARERLTQPCFTQIATNHRNDSSGNHHRAPPPAAIKAYKLAALVKQSHADALCTREELDQVLGWLDDTEAHEGDVTLQAFEAFHTTISDGSEAEDAAFLTYLMRVWRFERDETTMPGAFNDVLTNYVTRCQQLTALSRKREVHKKLSNLTATLLPSRLKQWRQSISDVDALRVTTPVLYELFLRHTAIVTTTLVHLTTLRLIDVGLTELPAFLVALPGLEVLELRDNRLTTPLPVVLGSMKSLKALILTRNQLNDRIFPSQSTAWDGLSQLETLILDENQLTIVPTVIAGLVGLVHLSIASNRLRGDGFTPQFLTRWHSETVPSPSRLQTLDLHGNQLINVPNEVFSWTSASLEHLFLHGNTLSTLPDSLTSLKRLRALAVHHNQLQKLPSSSVLAAWLVHGASELKEFEFSHSKLKTFPFSESTESAVRVDGLLALRMHSNRVRRLPSLASSCVFSSCLELELSQNAIKEIHDEFFSAFPRLRVCRLQQNALTHFPSSIECCKELEVLQLEENRLISVPTSLSMLSRLRVLTLHENQLKNIPSEYAMFTSYRDEATQRRLLEILELHGNPIRNKVLQALIDGQHSQMPFKTQEIHTCERVLRKLIAQDFSTAPRPSCSGSRGDTTSSEEEPSDTDLPTRRPWKGKARGVIEYLEARLRALCRGRRSLLQIPTDSFRRLFKSLALASSDSELAVVVRRYQCDSSASKVDGWRFLLDIERLGLTNALGDPGDEGMKPWEASVRKPVDSVAGILQYLQVVRERNAAEKPVEKAPIKIHPTTRTPKQKPTKTQPQPMRKEETLQAAQMRTIASVDKFVSQKQTQKTASAREIERQRQRIQVLEQQLMDQQLLRLSKPPTSSTAWEDPEDAVSESCAPVLHVQIQSISGGDSVVIACPDGATVLDLKRAIASRLSVSVEQQILIARRHLDGQNQRLRDDMRLDEQLERVAGQVPATHRRAKVLLLVSQQIHVAWPAHLQQTSTKA
ncbi:hypothetical protein Poli38472_003454 [Pythium oligandrum]|uniref:Ubiquitin-like domain-containing protein n=1 Tax=Pythium oligandrum TaxID=41045 RepID=A0A8K1C6U8_PYTOL|nr:hypothetical protein Poli38472_003454 [Pythium oligandrum]|eukprot:TMW57529.1 hypothetical protein Poli38472_003454 [Pythium oligandrum]